VTHGRDPVTASRDRGHDPLSSEAAVVVRIDDMNDNAPSVTVRTLHGSSATELPESSAIGSFVAHVSVVDHDSAAPTDARPSQHNGRATPAFSV